MIGKIQEYRCVKLKHEALDLTKWLQDNIDVLNDSSILPSNAEREQSAGDFSVDLVAEDEDGSLVVIEPAERATTLTWEIDHVFDSDWAKKAI